VIYVDRAAVPSPAVLTGASSKGVRECTRIKNYYAQLGAKAPAKGRKTKKVPKHRAYGEDEVKQALHTLFNGKCAYCESRYASTQPVDVEHYRPKAGVAEDEAHRGYFWLGATWENLLPSCIDCNREREHVPQGATQPTLLGKGTRFPLLNPDKRVSDPAGNLGDEAPVLLNPCRDDPVKFLQFGTDAVARAKPAAGTPEEIRALQSIMIYGLNRPALVEARLEVLRLVQSRIVTINRLVAMLERPTLGTSLKNLVEDLIAHEMAELRRFREPRRPYSRMCHEMIDAFEATLRLP